MKTKSILRCGVASFMLTLPLISQAVTAWPGLLKGVLPDGSETYYRIIGDERGHMFVDEQGYELQRLDKYNVEKTGVADFRAFSSRMNKARVVKRLPGPSFPTTGRLKGIVLLVEFADNEFMEGHDASVFHAAMNEPGCTANDATGSVRDYFIAQSGGLFTPEFDVAGPVKLSHNMAYYGANDRNGQDLRPAEMVKEACEKASEELGVDFSNYDYNDDGIVDFVYIYYAGYAESYGASSSTIWPHASTLQALGADCEVNGKTVSRYACSSELKYISGTTLEGIGTFCHEFSHVLGLPDLYNTRYTSQMQLGQWDVMDQGNYNNESHTPPSYSAFERMSLGWMEPEIIDTPGYGLRLPEMTSSGKAFRIDSPNEDEFFMLENRQQEGWDEFLPGHGLMVTHIAYDQAAWDGNYVNSGTIQRVDLEEADGTQGNGQPTDLFPYGGTDMFTDYSAPSSLTVDGKTTGKGVTCIKEDDGVITFNFMHDRLDIPENLHIEELKPDRATLAWSPVENADTYGLRLDEVLDETENPVIVDEDFSGLKEGSYPNAEMTEIGDDLDNLLSTGGWYGTNLRSAGGELMIGYYGQAGNLNSPVFDLSEEGGHATVALRARSYPGKSVNLALEMLDVDAGAAVTAKHEVKVTKSGVDIVWHIDNASQRCRFVISTQNERVFIDDLRILRGEIADEEVWDVGPQSIELSGIEGCSAEVTGLVPEHEYIAKVIAETCDGMHESEPSEELHFTTPKGAGIEAIDSWNGGEEIHCYRLDGTSSPANAEGVTVTVGKDKHGNRVIQKRIVR